VVLTDLSSTRRGQISLGRNESDVESSLSAVQEGGDEVRLERKGRKILTWLLALTTGALGTWQVYHFQFSSGFDLFPGPRGDTRLTAYLVEHWYQGLLGHADLLSPAMFYPVKGTIGFTDLYLAYVPVYSLLRVWGYDIFLALGLTVIFLSYLNFISCFVLLNKVLKFNALASCTGALFFAFNNPKLAQPDHLQLQPVFLLPIVVGLVLVFFLEAPSLTERKAFGLLALAALCLNLQLLTSFYIGWFFVFWCFLMLVVSSPFRRSRLFILGAVTEHWSAVIGGVVVVALGFVPFLVVYLPAVRSAGWYGVLPQYIPEIKSFLLMADSNYIWEGLTASILKNASAGPDWGRRIGVGLVPSVAWVAASLSGIWVIKKYAKIPASTNRTDMNDQSWNNIGYLFLGLMILATNLLYIIGLQYRGHSLWNYVYLFFPGARGIRAVARYVIVLALPMAIAFAFAVQYGMQGIARRKSGVVRVFLAAAMLILITFGLFEQLNSSDGQYYSISAENARLEKLAVKLPENCSAFYVAAAAPGNNNQEDFRDQNYMHDAMLVSIRRHVPTLNGRSGKNPPNWSLRNVRAPEYEENVRQWIKRHKVEGNVCRLEIVD